MMSENILYFQHRDGNHDFLVNVTEFRRYQGPNSTGRITFTYALTIINENGHHTFKPENRQQAMEQGKQAVRTFLDALQRVYEQS